MVFVKVRETYDLHTIRNKITAIGIHTPSADIIKRNYPGLLMQCKAYRPVSCDVRLACASMLPVDPQGVGLAEGDIAPEDLFNPILYKACTNMGMSQIEARIQQFTNDSASTDDIRGSTAVLDYDSVTDLNDEFNLYYGMLADTHQWKHANPQTGLSMKNLRPKVFEMLYSVGDNTADYRTNSQNSGNFAGPLPSGNRQSIPGYCFRGNGKPIPFINTTSYSYNSSDSSTVAEDGFKGSDQPLNASVTVPAPLVYVSAIIVPPSRLHQLFYRMVVEWTLEFSMIRTVAEITNWSGLVAVGNAQHYKSYDYSASKSLLGIDNELLENETCMVNTNGEIQKVM